MSRRILASVIALAIAFTLGLSLAGCESPSETPEPTPAETTPAETTLETIVEQETSEEEAVEMQLSINGTDVSVAWEDNQAVADLVALASDGPFTIELSMYGGFEQVGPIGTSLTAHDEQVTTEPGDIVLYAGDQISIFYGTNSWAYTRLGHITDKTADEMADLLGNGDVSITITVR